MDTFYDYFMLYEGIGTSILNVMCFLLMTFVSSKKSDSFKKLIRFGKLIESLTPFFLGVVCNSKSISSFTVTSCKGLCHSFGIPLACKLGLLLSMVSVNFIVGLLSIACLWRYNVFVRKVKYSKLEIPDIIFLSCCFFIGPLPQLITVSGMGTLDEDFVPMNEKEALIKENYLSQYHTIIIIRNNPKNIFSWTASFNMAVLFCCLLFGIIYYYLPIELSLQKAVKESQSNTASNIKFNIYYMRLTTALVLICMIVPTFTLTIFSLMEANPAFLESINSLIYPGILFYFWFSPFICLYNYYKIDIALYRNKKVMVVVSNFRS